MSAINDYISDLNWTEEKAIKVINQWLKWAATKKKYQNKYYAKNKEKVREYRKTYYQNNPDYRSKAIARASKHKSQKG